ncbi:lipopolysaccharide biosynthesis protein [Hyphomonas sp. WL0036]|uniref:lipopolysaccharide biosynthesis protein n=1 Tax=Hyphomonas sediminis TaxID=2866160 RepID=UPI001C807F47|nr:lipopolysaccharide biosynthesis protein [Hyphomonas sediminis]MBY9067964.1 lipopolysaccharide biosynthesis protein [Hyphomonas sediminis]
MTDNNTPANFGNEQEVSPGRVIRATAWLGLAKLVSYGLAFLSTIVLARILVPEDFGVIALAMAIIGVLAGLLDVPVTTALVALQSPTDDEFDTAWTISIIRSVLVSLLLFALAYPLAGMFNMPEVAPVIMALSAQLIIFGLRNPYFENFARSLNFTWDVYAEISSKICQIIVSIAVALIWKSYWAFVVGLIAGALASMIVTYIAARRLPKLSLRSPQRLLGYSIWLGMSMVVNRLASESANLIAGKRFGQAMLGELHIGNKLSTDISYIALIPIIRSLLSAFSRLADDMHRFRHAYLKAQAATVAMALPMGVGLALVADPLVPLMLGPGWDRAIIVVQYFAPCASLLMAAGPIRSVAMALGKTRVMLGRDVILLVIRVTCLVIGTWTHGFLGLLVAYVASTILTTIVNLAFLKRLLSIRIVDQVRNFARSIISTLMMAGAVMVVDRSLNLPDTLWDNILTVGVLSATGAATYATVHTLLWLAGGRPDGIEQSALLVARKLKLVR